MKFTKTLTALFLAAALVFGLAACTNSGGKIEDTEAEVKTTEATTAKDENTDADTKTEATEDTSADPASASGVDLSEEVTLVMYCIGDEPADIEMVRDALNEKLVEKFNTKLDFQFSTWTDYNQKLQNILTTQGADMTYIASWLNYQVLANTGAFEDIEPYLTAEIAPYLSSHYSEGELNSCRVNGTLYCIPNLWPEYVHEGMAYRKDLAEKYNIPEPIESLENLEGYMQGLVDNGYDAPICFNISSGNTCDTWPTSCSTMMHYFVHPGYRELKYGYMFNNNDPLNIEEYWHTDAFLEDAKLMKKWADAGYWSRSALSADNDTTALGEGRTTIYSDGTNPNKWVGWRRDAVTAGNDDYDIAWWSFANMDNYAYPAHPTQNATALVNGTKYPERCLMVVDYLMSDPEANALIQCGIEGVHYELDENGFYKALGTGYGYEACDTWCWRNGELKLQQASDVDLQAAMDHDQEIAKTALYPEVNIVGGFSEDYTDYAAERTAVMSVCEQYLNPIMAGLVDDPEAAVSEFLQKVDAAGLDICVENCKKQWEAYCQEFGYTESR